MKPCVKHSKNEHLRHIKVGPTFAVLEGMAALRFNLVFSMAVAIASAGIFGCEAGDPGVSPEPRGPTQTSQKADDPPEVPFVKIIKPLSITKWHTVPFEGKATPGATLVYESPAAGLKVATVGNDGYFCVNIPLMPSDAGDETGVANKITFKAVRGNFQSDVVEITVVQKGVPPVTGSPIGPDTSSNNIARGLTIQHPSHIELKSPGGVLANITDGSLSPEVTFQHKSSFDYNISQRPQLVTKFPNGGATLQTVKVTTNEECSARHSVYYSDVAEGAPNYIVGGSGGSAGWTLMPRVRSEGRVHTYSPDETRPHATWIAVVLTHGDCSGTFSQYPISELEVFGILDSSSEVSPGELPPSCESI